MMRTALLLLCTATLTLSAQTARGESRPAPPAQEERKPQCPPRVIIVQQERPESEDAEAVAMSATGGKSVWSRKIDLNGATGGWEVGIHMKDQDYGWRVIIDRDTWTVRRKEKIANP
jgi:hypothetical protein